MSTPTTKPDTSPYRGDLTAHPSADIFPLMAGPEYDAFVDDIKTNWLREPITLFEGKILDGRNRYNAVVKANLLYKLKEENFREFKGNAAEAITFVVSANLHRRHLTESQRAVVAAKLVTTTLGHNQYNNAKVTNEQAAKLLGVSEATVKMAKDVAKKAAPEIAQMVQNGKIRLGMAKEVIKKPQPEQQAELVRIQQDAQKRKNDAKAKREAAKAAAAKAAGAVTPSVPKANQAVIDLDEFKKKWQGFSDMQRRGFVGTFIDELEKLIKHEREQQAMIGGAPIADAA